MVFVATFPTQIEVTCSANEFVCCRDIILKKLFSSNSMFQTTNDVRTKTENIKYVDELDSKSFEVTLKTVELITV
jgi:hypothetical protein